MKNLSLIKVGLSLGLSFMTLISQASTKEERKAALNFYTSLTGASPSRSEVDLILRAKEAGNLEAIAYDIIESRGGFNNFGSFYNVTVKDFATPWSSEEGLLFEELNDMTATVIGYTRDELPFNEILWRDGVYKAIGVTFKGGQLYYFSGNNYPAGTSASTVCAGTVAADPGNSKWRIWYVDPLNPNSSPTDVNNTFCRLSNYSKSELDQAYFDNALYVPSLDRVIATNRIKESNRHYQSLEKLGVDLSNRNIFQKTTQLEKLHRSNAAIAGLLSTRAFGKAYYSAGTNRAALAFSMKYFFCKDMEELNDTTIPDFRNRRDVDRSPGGNSSIYKNRCVGCHGGMDALAGAFAYYDWNGGVTYEPGIVVSKMNHNVIFPDGYVTSDNSWLNLWDQGQNASLGWGSPRNGYGAKSLGQLISTSDAFPKCMSEQVFKKVCFREPDNGDLTLINNNAEYFKNTNFNMKRLFIKTALDCMED